MGIAIMDFVAEAMAETALFELADALPDPEHPGRPREWPNWVYVLFIKLARVVPRSSLSSSITELGSPMVWELICRLARERFPDDPTMWADHRKTTPPSRGAVRNKAKLMRSEEWLKAERDILRRTALREAKRHGLLGGSEKGSATHPSSKNVMTGDVTTVKPMFRSKHGRRVAHRTGEIRDVRYDPEAVSHTHGDGVAWGHPMEIVETYGAEAGGLRILDVAPLLGGAQSEGHLAVDMAIALADGCSGQPVFAYDGALRGVHVNRLHRHGILAVYKQHEETSVDEATGQETKVPRQYPIGAFDFVGKDRSRRTFPVDSLGGHACIKVLDENGTPQLFPLSRFKTERRGRTDDSCYFYNLYRAPRELGGGVARIRMTQPESGAGNIEEHVHVISRQDPDFRRLFAPRPGAESTNAWLKRPWLNKRARFFGRAGALLTVMSDWFVNILTCNIKARRATRGLGLPPSD